MRFVYPAVCFGVEIEPLSNLWEPYYELCEGTFNETPVHDCNHGFDNESQFSNVSEPFENGEHNAEPELFSHHSIPACPVVWGKTTTVQIPAEGECSPTPDRGHDLKYRHSAAWHNLDAGGCARAAVLKASLLRNEVLGVKQKCTDIAERLWGLLPSNGNAFKAGVKALAAVLKIPGRWIADTGSASDLGAASDLDPKILKQAHKISGQVLHTANGETTITKAVTV
jgi:hypothetical protein